MPHPVGLENVNEGDGRKKVRSVVDSKQKAGNSIKMIQERVSKMESVRNRTIHTTVFVISCTIWHKNMQKGNLKLLAPFKEQDVPNQTLAVSQLWLSHCCQSAHTALVGEVAGGQGKMCRTLQLMFLYCLNMSNETRNKMENVFHAQSINCSVCFFPSFLPTSSQRNSGLEHVAVELHCGAVLRTRPGRRKRA